MLVIVFLTTAIIAGYLFQVILSIMGLFSEDFKTKKEFYNSLIPFYPVWDKINKLK